jgi:hypothetical protein
LFDSDGYRVPLGPRNENLTFLNGTIPHARKLQILTNIDIYARERLHSASAPCSGIAPDQVTFPVSICRFLSRVP